jgi:hypothetical protein
MLAALAAPLSRSARSLLRLRSTGSKAPRVVNFHRRQLPLPDHCTQLDCYLLYLGDFHHCDRWSYLARLVPIWRANDNGATQS